MLITDKCFRTTLFYYRNEEAFNWSFNLVFFRATEEEVRQSASLLQEEAPSSLIICDGSGDSLRVRDLRVESLLPTVTESSAANEDYLVEEKIKGDAPTALGQNQILCKEVWIILKNEILIYKFSWGSTYRILPKNSPSPFFFHPDRTDWKCPIFLIWPLKKPIFDENRVTPTN